MARGIGLGLRLNGMRAALDAFRDVRDGYGAEAKWVVGVGVEYGAYLEFGTSRMQPYPFLFPAARDVWRRSFDPLEQRAHSQPNPTEWLVQELALAIENQAKVNADAANEAFSGQRSPGTHPGHPQIQTSSLVGSIEASPAGSFGGIPRGTTIVGTGPAGENLQLGDF